MFQLLLHSARVCIVLLSLATMCRGELEALKAAEISREIRQQFRISGMNWVSPKMLQEVGESCLRGRGYRLLSCLLLPKCMDDGERMVICMRHMDIQAWTLPCPCRW